MVPSHYEDPLCPPADALIGLDERQTLILQCLTRLTPPVDLTELAIWVFVSEDRPDADRTQFEPGVGRVKARLHRVDLPQLERLCVLNYDPRRREITSFDVPDRVRPDR